VRKEKIYSFLLRVLRDFAVQFFLFEDFKAITQLTRGPWLA
jgi:hypothetical protein